MSERASRGQRERGNKKQRRESEREEREGARESERERARERERERARERVCVCGWGISRGQHARLDMLGRRRCRDRAAVAAVAHVVHIVGGYLVRGSCMQ